MKTYNINRSARGTTAKLRAVLLGAVILSTHLAAGTLTTFPTKDAEVKVFFPTTNYGTATILETAAASGFAKNSFIQFTVSGIPAGMMVTSANLLLYAETTGSGQPVSAHACSNTTWSETGITWNNQPSYTGTALSTVSSFTSGNDATWDVSGLVTGNGTFCIALDTTDTGSASVFGSREAGGALRPELVVTYASAGLVGNTTPIGAYAGATTRLASATTADGAINRIMSSASPGTQKIFYQPGNFPQALVDGTNSDVSALVTAGVQFWLCYQPVSSGSDLAAMKASLQFWQTKTSKIKVAIFSEPQNFTQFTGQPNPATAYLNCVAQYAPMIHSLGLKIVYDAAGHAIADWIPWCPDTYADEISIDYYGDVFEGQYSAGVPWSGTGSSDNTDDPSGMLRVHADSLGVPFGFGELGSAVIPATTTSSQFTEYIGYIQTTMTNRLAAGLANGDVAWYNGNRNDPNINTLVGPKSTTTGATIAPATYTAWTGLTGQDLTVLNASAFAAGGENMFVQTALGVVVISFQSISGNTLQNCAYVETFNGTAGNITSGLLVACWPFNKGVTSDFRVPLIQGLYDALSP